jgi:hypothetical protein
MHKSPSNWNLPNEKCEEISHEFHQEWNPVCPDVLINPVFQVLSDEGRLPGSLLIVNICPALIKHLTPLSHIRLIHYTFPILTISYPSLSCSWGHIICSSPANWTKVCVYITCTETDDHTLQWVWIVFSSRVHWSSDVSSGSNEFCVYSPVG